MNIQSVVSTFPDFAKIWAEKRLARLLNQTGSLPNEEVLISVKDYLASLTSEDKIYQKLNKVSWSDIVQLQKHWHDMLAAKAAKMTEFGGVSEAETFIDCKNGRRWVKLETPKQFDFEGNAMGHCLGKGSYDKSKNRFFSLRDRSNLPHITVEFNPRANKYTQIQGRANEPVIADYWKDTVSLFKVLGEGNGFEQFAHSRDYVCSKSGIWFKPEDIKRVINDDSVFITSAKITNTSFGVTTKGKFLYLIEEPPEGTSFKTVMLTQDSDIRDWKWNVSEDFNASKSLLETIANNVKFGGNVNISGTRIKHWQNNVTGYFNASESLLESVSASVKFGGYVNIAGTRIKYWQYDVPGNFYAYDSLLEIIADDVKFGRGVNIAKTRVKHWKHNVSENFGAYDSLLETIADNVKLGGNVNISGTRIKRWHNDVSGNFNASKSLLEAIAENVKFGGIVNIHGTKAASLFADTTKPESYILTPRQ